MPRIESLGEFFHFTNAAGKKKTRSPKRAGGRRFDSLVSEAGLESAESEELTAISIEELLDAVHLAGEELRERQSVRAVEAYRGAVRRFLGFVLKRLYVTEKHRSRPSPTKGTQREYTLIRTVDEKLERLVAGVLQNQMRHLEILERMEEIEGLLVDLVR